MPPATEQRRRSPSEIALRIALFYALAAALWILLSDWALVALELPSQVERVLNSAKGLLFVLVTATALYTLTLRATRRLYRSELRYRRLFENAPTDILLYRVLTDVEGRPGGVVIEGANPAQLEHARASPEAFMGRMASSERLPEQLRPYGAEVLEAIAEDRPGGFEIAVDATDSHYLVSVFPLEPGLWASAAVDVSELRRAQRALEGQKDAIRRAYMDVLDAVSGGKLVLMTREEIEAALGEATGPPRPMESYLDVSEARPRLAEELLRLGLAVDADLFLHPFAEAATNAVKHAGRGEWSVRVKDRAVQVVVADHGGGIDFRTLPAATLVPGYSTVPTLGMGFTIMLQYADRVLLTTESGRTVVALEVADAVAPERGAGPVPGERARQPSPSAGAPVARMPPKGSSPACATSEKWQASVAGAARSFQSCVGARDQRPGAAVRRPRRMRTAEPRGEAASRGRRQHPRP
ncbi:MAG: ATP-binding protein [Coriobacteriia bacterium]|nr:ATP-binding protein [Coriobacteriia bacterium]